MWKNNCFRIFYNVVMWISKRYTLYYKKEFFLMLKNYQINRSGGMWIKLCG